jgi:hypothetical protein
MAFLQPAISWKSERLDESVIRKKPALGLDPRVDSGFPNRIMLQLEI